MSMLIAVLLYFDFDEPGRRDASNPTTRALLALQFPRTQGRHATFTMNTDRCSHSRSGSLDGNILPDRPSENTLGFGI
jgi:hypothetical protein